MNNITDMLGMFYCCSNLTSIIMPANVKYATVLPSVSGYIWKDADGVKRTETLANLAKSMVYTRVASSDQKPGETGSGDTDNNNADNNTDNQNKKKIAVKKINLTYNGNSVNGKTLTIKAKSKYTFKAAVSPSNATDKKVTWKSSNKKVATVSSKGVVKGIKNGTATITVKSSNGKQAKFKVKVQTKNVKVTKVSIKAKKKTVKKGKKITLQAVVTPVTAKNVKVSWKSSDKKIATVNSKGVVTGKKKGKVTITATAKDGSKKKAKITIKVK